MRIDLVSQRLETRFYRNFLKLFSFELGLLEAVEIIDDGIDTVQEKVYAKSKSGKQFKLIKVMLHNFWHDQIADANRRSSDYGYIEKADQKKNDERIEFLEAALPNHDAGGQSTRFPDTGYYEQ